MVARPRYRFDRSALYAALDAQRRQRGISWLQVARETGVSISTLTATRNTGRMETDGMLSMVRWLGRAPEDFIRPSEPQPNGSSPPPISKFLVGQRFDTTALYAALDAQRRSRKMTWQEVAQDIGGDISAAMLTRLAKRGRIAADVMVAAVGWLGTGT